MIHLLCGHRGSGKTHLLKQFNKIYSKHKRDVLCFDLDQEIENRSGLTINKLFECKGEAAFRKLERATLASLVEENANYQSEIFIALGAGYMGPGLDHLHTIWVRRETDQNGRIFLDRPRLESELKPLEEYRKRSEVREQRWRLCADEQLLLPEGENYDTRFLERFLNLHNVRLSGCLTLLPENFLNADTWSAFCARRKQWGLDYFEIRDDLLSQSEIDRALRDLENEKLLFTVRKGMADNIPPGVDIDWPLERGDPPTGLKPVVISYHGKDVGESLEQQLEKLNAVKEAHIKWAPEIDSLIDLQTGHHWWQEDPSGRSFLPRSKNGKWNWYRMRQKGLMKLNFIREGHGSSADQPTLAQWSSCRSQATFIAAVLGNPVAHSFTPTEHMNHFRTRGPVLAIELTEEMLSRESLKFLAELGLTHAAVTSPLKNKVFELCDETSEIAQKLESVNTLRIELKNDQLRLEGTNTDIDGLKFLMAGVDDETSVAIWGGGGTRGALREILPGATYYSARRGDVIHGQRENHYDILVWAVGRNRMKDLPWPEFSVGRVVDLNYSSDSPGLEFALNHKCDYTSGLKMFRAQAAAQREWWSQRDGGDYVGQ